MKKQFRISDFGFRISPHITPDAPLTNRLWRIRPGVMCGGFTLLEVIMVTTVFSLVLAAVMAGLLSGQQGFSEAGVFASLETEATILMDNITEHLSECKIYTAPLTATQHALMRIQYPVPVSGTYWSDNGLTIYWGASNQQNWVVTFTFYSKALLDESVTQIDYNHDGDLTDKFEQGEIRMIIADGAGVVKDMIPLGDNVIVVYNSRDADINKDGQGDPLFQMVNSSGTEDTVKGNRLIINFWLCKVTPDGVAALLNARQTVTMLNPQ